MQTIRHYLNIAFINIHIIVFRLQEENVDQNESFFYERGGLK